MKKILNSAFSRVVIVAIFLLIQLAVLLVMIFIFQEYWVYFYGVCQLISVLALLYIINSRSNPAYKIAWIIPILSLPIFGWLFYLMFGKDRITKHERSKMSKILDKYEEAIKVTSNELPTLLAENKEAALQATYLRNAADAPVYKKTSTEFLKIGEVMFEKLLEELEKAQKFILIEFFIIQEGKMWDPMLEILERKVKQGVDVRVMYDYLGCLFTLPDNYPKILEEKGIKACAFNRFNPVLSSRFNNRDHRKICVIDGNVGFTGGVNIADEYINAFEKHGHWLDCGILIKGEAVWSLTVMFLSMWGFVRNETENFTAFVPDPEFVENIKDDGYVQPFTDTPMDNEPVGETVYMNMINRAKDYVYICTPYLIIDNEMQSSLCTAAKCGVDVRIITPFIADKGPVHAVTRSYYPVLIEAGVRIFEYTPGFIHSKTFVADDEYGVVGTINLDYRSLFLHFECAVWLHKCSALSEMKANYLETLERCTEITYEKAMNVNGIVKLWRAILRVMAPLM